MNFVAQLIINVIYRLLAFYYVYKLADLDPFVYVYANAPIIGQLLAFAALGQSMTKHASFSELISIHMVQLILGGFIVVVTVFYSVPVLFIVLGTFLFFTAEMVYSYFLTAEKYNGVIAYYAIQILWPMIFIILSTFNIKLTSLDDVIILSILFLLVFHAIILYHFSHFLNYENMIDRLKNRINLLSLGVIEIAQLPLLSFISLKRGTQQVLVDYLQLITLGGVLIFLLGNIYQYYGKRSVRNIINIFNKNSYYLLISLLTIMFSTILIIGIYFLHTVNIISLDIEINDYFGIVIFAVGVSVWQWRNLDLINSKKFHYIYLNQLLGVVIISSTVVLTNDAAFALVFFGLSRIIMSKVLS